MRQITYKKTDIVILCYSLTDGGKSIGNIEKYWIQEDLGEYGPKTKNEDTEEEEE